jgi:hypothetical protein
MFEGLRGTPRWTFTATGLVTSLAARLAGIAEAVDIRRILGSSSRPDGVLLHVAGPKALFSYSEA